MSDELPNTDQGNAVAALIEFARSPDPAGIDVRFADEVEIGIGSAVDARVQRTLSSDVDDRDAWVVDVDGVWGRAGDASALDLLSAPGVAGEAPGSPDPVCPEPLRHPLYPDPEIVVLRPVNADACFLSYAVTVRVVGGEITQVLVRLFEP